MYSKHNYEQYHWKENVGFKSVTVKAQVNSQQLNRVSKKKNGMYKCMYTFVHTNNDFP